MIQQVESVYHTSLVTWVQFPEPIMERETNSQNLSSKVQQAPKKQRQLNFWSNLQSSTLVVSSMWTLKETFLVQHLRT